MPITNPEQYRNFDDLFGNLSAEIKCCLFVFLTRQIAQTSGDKIRKLLNEFNSESEKTQIYYPIYFDANTNVVKKLWDKYNQSGAVPCFFFTDEKGNDVAVSYSGLPTKDELLEKFNLVVPE